MDDEIRKKPSPWTSSTLALLRQHLPSEAEQPLEAACGDCPISVWHWRGHGDLQCFCPALHQIVWDGRLNAVMLCDARDQEIDRLPPQG